MANLEITRKLGETRAVKVMVKYEESYDLSATTIRFWLDAPDGTPKIEGADAAPAEDITPEGATPQTVWKLTYAFDADDLTETGRHKGEFEVDFGGDVKEYYPLLQDTIQVYVAAHPASTA